MKKLFILLTLCVATVAQAQHHGHHGHGHRHGHHGGDWMAPLIIGGVATYALTRPQPVVVQQPPVVVQQPQVIPYGYRQEYMFFADCNCYKLVLIQN
jgi:hypothetical protein